MANIRSAMKSFMRGYKQGTETVKKANQRTKPHWFLDMVFSPSGMYSCLGRSSEDYIEFVLKYGTYDSEEPTLSEKHTRKIEVKQTFQKRATREELISGLYELIDKLKKLDPTCRAPGIPTAPKNPPQRR